MTGSRPFLAWITVAALLALAGCVDQSGGVQEGDRPSVYRHAMDVDGSGDRLAFGSTTGSLFVTEDGGDSWTRVSAHLPPVYCVRFAPATP